MKRIAAILALLLVSCGSGEDEDGLAKLRAFAEAEAPCETAADCCVVIDGCLATAYVVAAADYDAARAVAAALDHEACVACISPSVRLTCEAGRCVGTEIEPDASGWSDAAGEHCGAESTVVALAAPEGESGRVLGCGAD